MKIEELFNELSEKWICSGNWAPHPFFTNGLIELSILRVGFRTSGIYGK
jgi:hypothetical protein